MPRSRSRSTTVASGTSRSRRPPANSRHRIRRRRLPPGLDRVRRAPRGSPPRMAAMAAALSMLPTIDLERRHRHVLEDEPRCRRRGSESSRHEIVDGCGIAHRPRGDHRKRVAAIAASVRRSPPGRCACRIGRGKREDGGRRVRHSEEVADPLGPLARGDRHGRWRAILLDNPSLMAEAPPFAPGCA